MYRLSRLPNIGSLFSITYSIDRFELNHHFALTNGRLARMHGQIHRVCSGLAHLAVVIGTDIVDFNSDQALLQASAALIVYLLG